MKISIKTGAVTLLAILGTSSIALRTMAACNPPDGEEVTFSIIGADYVLVGSTNGYALICSDSSADLSGGDFTWDYDSDFTLYEPPESGDSGTIYLIAPATESTDGNDKKEVICKFSKTGWTSSGIVGCEDKKDVIVYKLDLTGITSSAGDDYAYISTTPAMPAVSASITPSSVIGRWRMHVEYNRTPRNNDTYFPGPVGSNWTTSDAHTWNIGQAFGTSFCGGKATVFFKIGQDVGEKVFHIRGNNPTEAAAETEIGATPWYVKPIARHESGTQNNRTYIQFNELGTLGSAPSNIKYCPNFGSGSPAGGWGIMQLDPPPTNETLWNWKQNIADGKAHLTNPCRTEAVAWIAQQEAQQQAEEPTKPLQNYIFTFNGVDFQKGTARTPTDACTIQRYNGAASWVIYWKNKTTTQSGSWEIRSTHRAYVDAVCGEVS